MPERGKSEREALIQRIVDGVRAKVAEIRAEFEVRRLTAEASVPPPKPPPAPRPWKPLAERTTDEILAEMLADRDAAIAAAEEARAKYERLEVDEAAREWRRNGTGLQ
jgi:hypothetical protein